MKYHRLILPLVAAAIACLPNLSRADDQAAAKPKPYPLTTCLVSGEKLDADADMKTFVFVHEGQEIKLCCKSCKKKFDKDPASYLKKLSAAPAKK
jgi:YHS domain-containing protein